MMIIGREERIIDTETRLNANLVTAIESALWASPQQRIDFVHEIFHMTTMMMMRPMVSMTNLLEAIVMVEMASSPVTR